MLKQFKHLSRSLLIMIFVLGLTACGGGGGGSTPPANSAPTASGVSITDDNGGNALVGNSLTGNYTYADVDNDTEGASTSRWLRNGAAIGGATSSSYTLVSSDGGQMITFEVTPVATAGTAIGTAVTSTGISVINSAPTASGVSITDDNGGNALVGDSLTGNYTYADIDNDTEGASTSRWLRNGAVIGGATSSSYTLVSSDGGQMITFEVTPVATAGTAIGMAVTSTAISVINSTPTASGVSITDDNGGNVVVGDSLTGNYIYGDVDDDAEGVSTFRWLRNGLAINGATALSYTLIAGDSGQSITFEVIPVAATGTTTGSAVTSAIISVVNNVPTASSVSITDDNGGNVGVGDSLTGNYTFNDSEGDSEGASIFRWLRNGAAINSAMSSTYVLVAADSGQSIAFEVTPVATTGNTTGSTVTSSSITVINSAPTASGLSITDDNGNDAVVGDSLTGNYTYSDADNDLEGTSTFRWLRSGVAIVGATGSTYTTVLADLNQTITLEVTPVAASGTTTGNAVISSGIMVNSVATPNSLSLRLTAQQVNSDGQDSTTITATVLDINQAVIDSVQVDFSTDTGKLSSPVVFTDVNGEAVVLFSADPADPSNQIATVTATVTGVAPASIPIEIIGTTLAITIANTSLQVPVGSTNVVETVTITAKDAGGKPIYNAPVIFTIATTGTAIVTPSIPQGVTDVRGEIQLTLTASGTGTATFIAQGLGTQVTVDLQVAEILVNNPFRITSPTVDPTPVTSGGINSTDRVAITVEADPALGITSVVYSSSIGTWLSSGTATSTVAFSGTATDTLIAAASDTGFATVVVSNAADANVFDSITVAMSPPPTAAALLSIQSDVNVLPLSIGSSVFTANLEATVRTDDASGNVPVFNVPVVFTLEGAPGGGEVLTRSFGVTDLNGVVRTQFTSGILPSAQDAVRITAAIVATPTVNDTIIVAIGGIGGSVAIGKAPVVKLDDVNDAIYRMDMSVGVADSNGGAVAGSNVTLDIWPNSYRTGAWYDHDPDPVTEECVVFYSGPPFTNEDTDEDLILDQVLLSPGPPPVYLVNEDVNQDSLLTPHNSTAGAVPPLVATDAQGVGAYQLTYLKQYARWIDVRTRGTATVQGTDTTGTLFFNLPILQAEADTCDLPGFQSPFDMVVTGAPGTIATILGAGVDPDTAWTLPIFEGNGNASWSATTGVMNLVPPVAPDTINRAQYIVSATALPGTEYLDDITISADPFVGCGAPCNQLTVTIRVRVIIQ